MWSNHVLHRRAIVFFDFGFRIAGDPMWSEWACGARCARPSPATTDRGSSRGFHAKGAADVGINRARRCGNGELVEIDTRNLRYENVSRRQPWTADAARERFSCEGIDTLQLQTDSAYLARAAALLQDARAAPAMSDRSRDAACPGCDGGRERRYPRHPRTQISLSRLVAADSHRRSDGDCRTYGIWRSRRRRHRARGRMPSEIALQRLEGMPRS